MAEQLLTGQPTPPTGPLPLTYQNLFTESTKVSQRKDVPLPNGKYAANAKELESFLQTPENQEAYYKMYSAPAMSFGAGNLDQFKVKLSGGLTSGEIAMQKAKPSLPMVEPVTQRQQMEFQDLNQPAIAQFDELKANKINKTATGKPLNTYKEMQDYFSSPENVSEWGKAYNYSIKTKGFDLNQIANNAKPKQSLKTVTEIQTTAAEQVQRDDLDQVDPEKLAELVYNAEELGAIGESIKLEKPIELIELVDGQLVTKNITELTYENYTQLLKKKYGKADVDTSLIQPSIEGQAGVYSVNEFDEAKGKVKENYLNIVATKQQDENRTKTKTYDQDVETKNRQLLSPDDQKIAQINDQIDALVEQMYADKYSDKGVAPDFEIKLRNLEKEAAQYRKNRGLASEQMFNSVTGEMIDTTPEEKQSIQIGAQKATEKYSSQSSKDQLVSERNLLWEKIQFVDQQSESAKKEWQSQNIPGSTAIGLAQEALGIEGGMTGESAKLFNTMVNLQNKKAELYGQLLTLNRLVYTNEDVFKREAELGIKVAAESVVEQGYGFSLFSDKNTMRTRMQEVEETKRFFDAKGIKLSNKQLLGSEAGLGESVGGAVGPMLNAMIDIGISSYGMGALAKGLSGSKYWQVTKEFMSNKYGAAGRFATSMTEGALPYLVQGTAYEVAGQSFGTGVAETAAEKLFDKYAAQGIEKFGGKYGKLTFILGRWLSGTSGETIAEIAGNIIPLFLENGFDLNKAYKDSFGETGDEQTKNLAILGMSCALFASPANLPYVFKTKQQINKSIAEKGSNPILEQVMRVLDDTIERMPTGEAATRMDERIYGDNPVEPLIFVEAPPISVNEDVVEAPVEGPAERPQETVEVEKRSANNGEEFFVVENDGKVNKNVLYRVNETNGQLEVKGYDAMQEGWVPASKTITEAVDRKSKENGIISSDKATRVAKQQLNINPDAERVISPEGKVLYQTPGQSAAQFGKNRERNTNTVRATADNTFSFLNGVKEKIISTIFPNAETKIDDQQSASYNKYRDAVRTKMKLNAGSFFSKGKAVLMESGMNKIPKVADFLAALVEDFSKTGKTIEVAASAAADVTTKVGLKIEDVVNSIISTEFFQDKFGSIAEASDYAKNLLTDLMINDKSVAQEIFGQNKEAYNQFIKFREGFNKYVAKNYTGSMNFKTDQNFYNNQMPDVAIKAREEEFQMEEKQRVQEQAKREDVANVLNLAGTETSTQNVEGVRYKQGELNAQQYLEMLGEDTNGLTNDEITAKAEVASEGVNLDTFNQAVANRTTNEQTRKKRETRLRKELKTKFGFNNPLAKLIAKGALPDMAMGSKRAAVATMMNKVIETAATRAGVTADEFLDNYLQFQKSTEQEFSDFVKNQPGGKDLYQRIGELGAQYKQKASQFLNDAKRFEKEGKTPEQIVLATGWSRGLSGDWKYSIYSPSSSIRVDSLIDVQGNDTKSQPLGVLLNDPLLYAAYPQLKELEVIFTNNGFSESSGSYGGDMITLNLANNSDLLELEATLQHEIQHAIQHIEGWQGGASPVNVSMESPYDVLKAIAEEFAEMGEPVSQLAIDEANRLYQRYASQIKGATRNDFAKLSEIIQLNLWDSTHPNFNEPLVDEFLKKFPLALSNDVIKLLDAATDNALYYHVYGEQEARRAEQIFKFFDTNVQKMSTDPELIKAWAKPNSREEVKQNVDEYQKLLSDYETFKAFAINAVNQSSDLINLTQRQQDVLLNVFTGENANMQNVPLNILQLHKELKNTEFISPELIETIENIIKLRSDYAYKGSALKNKILSDIEESFVDLEDDTSMNNPLFWTTGTSDKTLVPKKKYNPNNFKRKKKEYDAEKKQAIEASNAVQNFEPKQQLEPKSDIGESIKNVKSTAEILSSIPFGKLIKAKLFSLAGVKKPTRQDILLSDAKERTNKNGLNLSDILLPVGDTIFDRLTQMGVSEIELTRFFELLRLTVRSNKNLNDKTEQFKKEIFDLEKTLINPEDVSQVIETFNLAKEVADMEQSQRNRQVAKKLRDDAAKAVEFGEFDQDLEPLANEIADAIENNSLMNVEGASELISEKSTWAEQISEQYRKAKSDGSNPKLVESLEGLLTEVASDERFKTLFQGNRGAAFITQDATDLIVALTDPNLSTPLHEIAHIYEKYMTDAEKKTVLDMTGETSWSTNTSEYFARGFERYLYSGNAPTAKMMPLFDKLRTWLKDIYTQLTGSEIDVPLNQQMRDVYSAMLGEAKTPETEVTPANAPQTADAALADFISNKRSQGISDDQIYVGLLQSGFKAADLQDYFNLETRQTVATQIEENGPVKDEARIAADEAAGLYVRRTAEQLEMEMDSLTIEESQAMIENFSNASNLDAAIANKIQDILQKKAEGKDVQKDFEDLIATGTNLGRALQAFTRLKNQSGALRARNLISKLKQEGKKIPDAVKNKLLALGDAYDEAKAKLNNAKVAAENNPNGQSPVAGKSNIQYFQQQLANTQNIGQQFASVARPFMSEASYTSTWGTLIRGNLLTPTSTIINITSNAVKAVFNIPINLIASGVSELSALVGGTKGSMRGVDYYKYGWQFGFMTGVKKGVSILKKGNLPDTSQGLQIEPGFNGFRSMSELFGGLMAYAQGKSTADIAAEYGYNLDQSGKIPNKEKVIKTLEGIFGVPAEAFFRLLGSVDAVFRNTAYYSALSEQAKLSGLKDPKDIENFIILNSDYSNKAADNEALRYVYSNNSGAYKFISKIYGSGQGPGGKLWKLGMTGVIPYAKIPTNLAIEYSEIMIPDLAFAKAAIAAGKIFTLNTKIKKTKNPQAKLKLEAQKQELARKRDELIGRGVVGYALTYAGKWFAESGALSAGAQGEDKKRKDYVYRFERPNSINLSLVKRYINGDKNDLWQEGDAIVDYRAAGVFGGILFTSQSERRSTEKEQNKEVANQSVFSSLFDMGYNSNAAETARYLIDQSFVKGLNQALATVDPRQDGAIERFTSGLMGTLSTAILPNSLAIIDKANRNYIPEYDSPYTGIDKILTDFMAKVKERWPFDDPNNMTAKVDAFGRPIPQTPIGANAWFYNAFDVTKFSRGLYDDKDKSWEQLVYEAVKKGDVLTAFPSNPSPIVKSRVGGESYVLSPKDYQKYAIAVGEARRQIVNQFIENADLTQLIDQNSQLNKMTPDNQKPYGYVILGKILTNLYSAADATLINTERGLIYEARKKMAIERPEEFKKLIEKEKTNIYSQALDLLYNDPDMSQYIPKTTAQDIFFKKKGTYTEDREYLNEKPEADMEEKFFQNQNAPVKSEVDLEEEFFKQK